MRTRDGVEIEVQEWGRPTGPELLFVHGGFSSHLTWTPQIRGELAREFRLVTYDLRGHGSSGKPLAPEYYSGPERWADELHGVIAEKELTRPVLVGWSYGARVICDYLMAHGDGAITGVNLVGANPVAALNAPHPDAVAALAGLAAVDLRERVESISALVRSFFATVPPPREVEEMVACAAMVPQPVCGPMLSRPPAYEDTLRILDVPVLISHGTEDRLASTAVARHAAATAPHARLSVYDGAGHGVHREQPLRFDRELAEFARSAIIR